MAGVTHETAKPPKEKTRRPDEPRIPTMNPRRAQIAGKGPLALSAMVRQ
jgi:hypothetical protein